MVAEKFLSKIGKWVPDSDEISKLSAKSYGVSELYSEPVLLSEATLTKIFVGDPQIKDYFGKLMLNEPSNIYDMIFRSWLLKYFNNSWEIKYKARLDRKIKKYISLNGLPGKFSNLDVMYAMYLSFATDESIKLNIKEEPSIISYYLIYVLNSEGRLNKKLLSKLKRFQNKEGGFPSSRLTTMRSNIFGTILALIPLIVENPNSLVVKKALEFILKVEPPYSHFQGGDAELYVNMFAAYMLRLYEFFVESYKQEIVKIAAKNNKEKVNLLLYKEFTNYLSKSFELQRNELILRNSFGSKIEVRERRNDIYSILCEKGGMDPAEIIDELKKINPNRYKHIKKRSHLTMIKLDLEFMRHLGLLSESNSKYFII